MIKNCAKKTWLIVGFFCLLSGTGVFYYLLSPKVASAARDSLVYVVNLQKIWEDLPAAKQLETDLKKTLGAYHQQLSKTELELKAEHQDLLTAQKKQLSPQELQILERRKTVFENKVTQTQKDVETKQQFISERHQEMTRKLHAIIEEKIRETARQQGGELVLSSQTVVYSVPERDLTPQVFEKVKAATLNFPRE